MNQLFIALYLDEDVDILVSLLLRARGFDVVATRDAAQRGMADAAQLAFAVSDQRALLTHNRVDFERLAEQYALENKKHYGIIIATRRPAHELARRLLILLNQVTAEEFENQLRYV